MMNRLIVGLLVLNVALAGVLIGRMSGPNEALAQPVRRPADVMMIPGEVAGGTGAVVYMVDLANRQLGAMAYDDARREVAFMPPIDLERVFESAAGVGPVPGRGRAPGRY